MVPKGMRNTMQVMRKTWMKTPPRRPQNNPSVQSRFGSALKSSVNSGGKRPPQSIRRRVTEKANLNNSSWRPQTDTLWLADSVKFRAKRTPRRTREGRGPSTGPNNQGAPKLPTDFLRLDNGNVSSRTLFYFILFYFVVVVVLLCNF